MKSVSERSNRIVRLDLLISFVFICAFLMPSALWSQEGELRLTMHSNKVYDSETYYEDSTCFQFTVYTAQDTVYTYTVDDPHDLEWFQITIDSLTSGVYFVNLANCGIPTEALAQSITKVVEIRPGERSNIYFNLSNQVHFTDLEDYEQSDTVPARVEMQMELSYFDFRWNPDGNNPKFNLGAACSGYTWITFSKHVGFLIGGGLGYSFAQLQIDQETSANYTDEV